MSSNEPGWGRNGGTGQSGAPGPQGNSEQRPDPRPDQRPDRPPARPTEGPPDLDELWRDLSRRINGLFGGRGGGNTPPGQPRPQGGGIGGRPLAYIIGGLAAIAGVLWLASGFFIVPEGQTAAVTRFGHFRHLTSSAGFQWHWPYPVERHEMVDQSRLRLVEVGYRGSVKNKVVKESMILTGDQSIVDLQFAIQYRVTDARKYLYENNPAPSPEELIRQAAESAIREVVGRRQIDTVLFEEKAQVADEAQKLTQGLLDWYNLGITLADLTIQQAQAPEQVQSAFEDANKAAQDRERMINDGQAYANDVVPRADGSAERLRMEALAYRDRLTASAEGDAKRFLSVLTEYQKAPGITRDRMYLDTMQSLYQKTPKVLIDAGQGNGGSNPMFYLPLDKLAGSGSASASAAAGRPEARTGGQVPSVPEPSPAQPPLRPAPGAPYAVPPALPQPGAAAPSSDPRSGMRSRERDASR